MNIYTSPGSRRILPFLWASSQVETMCHFFDIRLPLLHAASERIVRDYFESHMTYALLKMEIILCLVISLCHSTIKAMSNSTSLKLLSLVTQTSWHGKD